MEEDIDKLEELLKEFEVYGDLDGIQDIRPYMKTLENLIKGYRELEAKLNQLLKYEDDLRIKERAFCKENHIKKSKIKETKEENEKRIDEMRPYKHQAPFDFGVLNGIDECCRKLLKDK